jgi:hypothetical protein
VPGEDCLNNPSNILFLSKFKEILYTCPFMIAPSFGSYHGVRDSGMLLIGKLLKQGLSVA